MPKWKKKYCGIRKKFKNELYKQVKNNIVYIPMIVKTFVAYKHRKHIHKIWSLLNKYPTARKEYQDTLFGEMLCGRDEILHCLCYIDKSFIKYKKSIPEQLAMGDALAVAYKVAEELKNR